MRHLVVLIALVVLTSWGGATAQVLDGAGRTYEPEDVPPPPQTWGATVDLVLDEPGYGEAVLGIAAERNPSGFLGEDPRGGLLASCDEGLLVIGPAGGGLLALTASALRDAGLEGMSGVLAGIDDQGWVYLYHQGTGLLRMAVTWPERLLYDPDQVAAAVHSALPMNALDMQVQAGSVLVAAGQEGLLALATDGAGVTRPYDSFMDAEAAGLYGPDSSVVALAGAGDDGVVLAVVVGDQTWLGLFDGREVMRVGDGPVLDEPVVPGGLASFGGGSYLAVTRQGPWWVNLSGDSARLDLPLELVARASGVRGAVEPRAALDGCGSRAFLVLDRALVRVTVGPRAAPRGDVLLALPDEQRVVRLDRGRDPVLVWEGDPLVNPVDVAVDRDGRTWIVDAGAQAVFRLEANGSDMVTVREPGGQPRAMALDQSGRPVLLDLSVQGEDGAQLPGLMLLGDDGAATILVRGAPLETPVDLAVTRSGGLLIADDQAGRVWLLEDLQRGELVPFTEVEAPVAVTPGPEEGQALVLSMPHGQQASIWLAIRGRDPELLYAGEPLVRPSAILGLPDGTTLVADSRADPFEAEDQSAPTGALFRFDPATGTMTPALDSWLVGRNLQGISLSLRAGDRGERDCFAGPVVARPEVDPLATSHGDEPGGDGGCAVARGNWTASPLAGLLRLVLVGRR